MPDWSWVALGYLVAYGGVTGYAVSLHRRTTRARRRELELDHPAAAGHPGAPERAARGGHLADVEPHEAGLG